MPRSGVAVLPHDTACAYTQGRAAGLTSPTMSTPAPAPAAPTPDAAPASDATGEPPPAQSRREEDDEPASLLLRGFSVVHGVLALLFVGMALILVAVAAREAWDALGADFGPQSAQLVIEAMGVLAAAVVALQIAQTITEEEVIRNAHISAPTRVRRFLSRFMVVIVVALGIEALVATFRSAHDSSTALLHAAGMVAAVGVLMAGWGLFIRLNRYAEELEPEAMREAKGEDHKVQ